MRTSRLTVGLTGGIATGKSTVLKELKALGAETLSSDEIAHEVLRRGGPAYAGALRLFGSSVLGPSGEVDRRALGARVFRDPAKLRSLERLTHPLIRREWLRRKDRSRKPVVVVDVPLLFEKGLEREFDLTMMVYTDPRTQARRLRRRDGMNSREAARRIALQWPVERKARLADIVLDNRKPLRTLKPVLKAHMAAFRLLASAGKENHKKRP